MEGDTSRQRGRGRRHKNYSRRTARDRDEEPSSSYSSSRDQRYPQHQNYYNSSSRHHNHYQQQNDSQNFPYERSEDYRYPRGYHINRQDARYGKADQEGYYGNRGAAYRENYQHRGDRFLGRDVTDIRPGNFGRKRSGSPYKGERNDFVRSEMNPFGRGELQRALNQYEEHGETSSRLMENSTEKRSPTSTANEGAVRPGVPTGPSVTGKKKKYGKWNPGKGASIEPAIIPAPAAKDLLAYASDTYKDVVMREPKQTEGSNPILIILDLNETLVTRKKETVHLRPHLNKFLQYAFENFEVMVWSSAQPYNVEKMIKKAFHPAMIENLRAIWARDRFGLSAKQYNQKVVTYKNLEKVWDAVEGPEPGVKWGITNTVLVDDSAIKARYQPYNHIELKPWDKPSDHTDTVLLELIRYLDLLKNQENVAAFIRTTPYSPKTFPIISENVESDGNTKEYGGVKLEI